MATAKHDRVAKRYARALFDVCSPQDFDRVDAQLKQLATLWNESADLRQSMLNPRVSDALRAEVVDSVAASVGGWATEPLKKTLHVLAALRKVVILPTLSAIFSRLLEEYRKSLSLEVTMARPANDDVISSLKSQLSTALGGEVSIAVKTDPELLGGLTIRLGDTLLDRSVAGTLQRLASQIR
jgi:F-type H+-transporting ATPase subunit delta